MNYRLFILVFIIILSSTTVLANTPTDLQFYKDGTVSGIYGGRSFDLRITFSSPVTTSSVRIYVYYDDNDDYVNPTSCDGVYCYLDNVFIPSAGQYEIRVTHLTNSNTFIVYVDTGLPIISDLRLFQRSNTWYVSANIFDPLGDSSSISGSGISKIEIIKDGNVIDTTTISGLTDVEFEKTMPFDIEGDNVVFTLRAYDLAGNIASSIFNRQLDTISPIIISVNENNNEWYSDSQGKVFVNVIIEEDDRIDLETSSIKIGETSSNFDSCVKVDSYFHCTVRLDLPPDYVGVSKNVNILIRDKFGNEVTTQFPVTLLVDDTRPSLEGLWSEARNYGDGFRAFLNDKEFFADFSDAPSGIDASSTIARILLPYNLDISADRCIFTDSGSRCYFIVPDTSHDSITAKIVRGYDNAGNEMIASNEEIQFHVDSQRPTIRVGLGSSHSQISLDEIVTIPDSSNVYMRILSTADEGSRINRINVKIFSLSSNELLSEHSFGTNDCTSLIDGLRCDIPPFTIDQDVRLEIEVYDGSGIVSFASRVISQGGSIMGSLNWRVLSQKTNPKIYFPGLPSQFIFTIELSPFENIYGTTVGQAGVTSCTATIGNVQDIIAFSNNNNNIRFSGVLMTNENAGGISEITCNLQVFGKRDRLISDTPDIIEVNFNLTSYYAGIDPNNPSVRAGNEDNIFSFLSKPTAINILEQAENVVEVGETICAGYAMFTGSSALLDAVAAGFLPAEPPAKAVDEALTKFETTAEKVCGYVTCETNGSQKVIDFYAGLETPFLDKLEDIGVLNLALANNRNVQDSLVQSVLSACIPGIVKNVRKIQQVQCGYAVCLLDAQEGNIPASVCDYARSTGQCEFFASELFVAMPYGLIVKDFSLNVNSLLTRPITIAGGFIMDFVQSQIPAVRSALKFLKLSDVILPLLEIEVTTVHTPDTDYCSILQDRLDE